MAGHKRQPHPAHGGSILYVDGTFYWYGENKEKSKADSGIWHWGVRCAPKPLDQAVPVVSAPRVRYFQMPRSRGGATADTRLRANRAHAARANGDNLLVDIHQRTGYASEGTVELHLQLVETHAREIGLQR